MKIVIFIFIFVHVAWTQEPVVKIKNGAIRGLVMRSRKDRLFFAFQGIPYAAPPINELRFQAPKEAPSWSGEFLAIKEGNSCLQVHLLFNTLSGDEDCLYLNVYTPQLKREGLLSVMVWIHGGGFLVNSGSSEFYGPHFLLDHDIILVTINYRLGPFGFLSLNTTETPGNYGLKDQVAALRWVQNNIVKFGGNPNSVTIFGQSAGAACTTYLMLSHSARGLFHRVIAQSGSVYNPWALTRNVTLPTLELAFRLGCDVTDPLNCLRHTEARYLTRVASTMALDSLRIDYSERAMFVPTLEPAGDGAFMTENPRAMIARGDISDVSLMAGLTTHEGILHLFVMRNWTLMEDYRQNFIRFVPEDDRCRNSSNFLTTCHKIKEFYKELSNGDFLEQYILLNTDVDFAVGVDEFVREIASLHQSPVYLYQFSYDGGLGWLKKLKCPNYAGTAHADELNYLFSLKLRLPFSKVSLLPFDQVTIDRTTALWTNFAIHGNPTPNNELHVKWAPIESPLNQPKMAKTQYLDIGDKLVMKSENMNSNRLQFWWKLRDTHCFHNQQ